jgi:hypothetical protein
MTHETPICYCCDRPATSDEHVPAKCFFPEQKDLPPGVDLRRNLFTVPSCDVHNSKKSSDDQYFWQIVTMAQGLNECGKQMVRTKVVRSMKRRPALVGSVVSTAKSSYVYEFKIKAWLPTGMVYFDNVRVFNTLEYFARALYFWHFKSKWPGAAGAFPNFTQWGKKRPDLSDRRTYSRILANTASIAATLPKFGENPDVFYYQVLPPDGTPGVIMQATFYGSVKIACGFVPQEAGE